MTPPNTTKWDVQEFLHDPDNIAPYLEAAFEDGDPAIIKNALNNVARAIGISKLEKETGLTRAALYKAFSDKGNPTLDTLLKVTQAIGVKMSIAA